ncbi:MAG: di-heme oxidoredictase family protein, partial [Planctomycetota bacterium]
MLQLRSVPRSHSALLCGLLCALLSAAQGANAFGAVPQRTVAQAPSPKQAATPAPLERNLALIASASASTTGPAGPPSFAVDGNPSTRWESQFGIDPTTLTLDLGRPFELSRTVIQWEAANAGTYTVDGSADGAAWTTLATFSGGLFGDRTDALALSGAYRYVRMNGLTRSPGNVYGYSIWEFEVYGFPARDADGDGVADVFDACPGTPPGTPVDGTGCEVIVPGPEVGFAGGVLVGGSASDLPGFTLYVTDDDLAAPVTSTCDGACAQQWPPLLVEDGDPNGVSSLSSIGRADGTEQVTYLGRPLYFFSGDAQPGDTLGDGALGVWEPVPFAPTFTPLFDASTLLEPALQETTPTALITRLSDRARDRHAREDQFQSYDHYLSHYWEHRTATIEIVDTVPMGGNTITFNVATQWRLNQIQAELRFFYRGINTVAEYFNNGVMAPVPALDQPGSDVRHYTRSVSFNVKEGRALQVGDRLEFELSQFLDGVPRGRNNYYGTAILYVVGEGIVPWEARGVFGNPATEREDSYPLPAQALGGGGTTLSYPYSNEPDKRFMQLATNLAPHNGQPFVEGRRVHHTDFGDGTHDETVLNPTFGALAGMLGPGYTARSCVACHEKNGRALPASTG